MAQAPEGPDWTRTAVAINTAAAHREDARGDHGETVVNTDSGRLKES